MPTRFRRADETGEKTMRMKDFAAAMLAFAAMVAVVSSAQAQSATSCSNATLNGTYTYSNVGWSISAGKAAPFSEAGFDNFNGAGTSTGVITVNSNGVVVNNNTPDSSTYTIKADCIGTIVFNIAGTLSHYNVYVSPSGDQFRFIETDTGIVNTSTETRVSK
jgi:hypothetical protein